ncbi:MAG: 4Fe-4S dicluster domain-containing protein [Dehalococcoidia bacterium]|nr:MAG: 4Fe-4S dicluster domain-containing protein [Dehalococcoidia bacterium]
MKKVYIKDEFCIGCRLCEVYCRLQHSKSTDLIKAFKKESPHPLPAVRVEEKGNLSLSVRCQHCNEPLCLYACPAGAINRDIDSGVIGYDPDKCIGCWSCILVCPFGAIKPDKEQKRVFRCDLCVGEEIPVCVANCPNEALVYIELQDNGRSLGESSSLKAKQPKEKAK